MRVYTSIYIRFTYKAQLSQWTDVRKLFLLITNNVVSDCECLFSFDEVNNYAWSVLLCMSMTGLHLPAVVLRFIFLLLFIWYFYCWMFLLSLFLPHSLLCMKIKEGSFARIANPQYFTSALVKVCKFL